MGNYSGPYVTSLGFLNSTQARAETQNPSPIAPEVRGKHYRATGVLFVNLIQCPWGTLSPKSCDWASRRICRQSLADWALANNRPLQSSEGCLGFSVLLFAFCPKAPHPKPLGFSCSGFWWLGKRPAKPFQNLHIPREPLTLQP